MDYIKEKYFFGIYCALNRTHARLNQILQYIYIYTVYAVHQYNRDNSKITHFNCRKLTKYSNSKIKMPIPKHNMKIQSWWIVAQRTVPKKAFNVFSAVCANISHGQQLLLWLTMHHKQKKQSLGSQKWHKWFDFSWFDRTAVPFVFRRAESIHFCSKDTMEQFTIATWNEVRGKSLNMASIEEMNAVHPSSLPLINGKIDS